MNVSYLAHQTIRNESVNNMVTFRNRRHMKLIQLIAIVVLMVTLFIAGINRFFHDLSYLFYKEAEKASAKTICFQTGFFCLFTLQ